VAILIVDDEPDMRTSLRFVLEVHGHQDIHTCSNGREAVEFLATSPTAVDLILTDISMPSVTGIDLCRFVKESPHLHDIPVVMITALMEEPGPRLSAQAGRAHRARGPSRGRPQPETGTRSPTVARK
jgi:CheY-like chemotaxis protein